MEKKNKQLPYMTLYSLVKVSRYEALAGLDPENDIKAIFMVGEDKDKDHAMHDETRYVVYTQYKLHLDVYVYVLKIFTRKGDPFFNVF